jgi:hypothetical protein
MSKANGGDRYCYGVQRERERERGEKERNKGLIGWLVVLVRKWHRIKAVAI